MAGAAKRVNISLPEEVHRLLQQLAAEHYGGNLSRYLADAGMFYAGVLAERAGRKEVSDVVSFDSAVREAWKLYRNMNYNSSEVVVIYKTDEGYFTETSDENGSVDGTIRFRFRAPRWYEGEKQPKVMTLAEWCDYVGSHMEP